MLKSRPPYTACEHDSLVFGHTRTDHCYVQRRSAHYNRNTYLCANAVSNTPKVSFRGYCTMVQSTNVGHETRQRQAELCDIERAPFYTP